MVRDLHRDMSGGTEAVEAEPVGVAGQAQGAVADEAGAQKRCRRHVAILRRQGEAKALVRHRIFGIAAVDVVAGEARLGAEILAAPAAKGALAAGPAEPGHPDARAGRKRRHLRPGFDHRADDLVARDQRQLGVRELAVEDVEIGTADPARVHANEHLVGPGPRHSTGGFKSQRLMGPMKHHGAHRCVLAVGLPKLEDALARAAAR